MTALTSDPDSPTTASGIRTAAEKQAAWNFHRNLHALTDTQPELMPQALNDAIEWLFGRDGALTAKTWAGAWIDGCSLPRRAACSLLKSLTLSGPVGCFLCPTHAQQILVALDKLQDRQAIICLMPDEAALHLMLHGGDFSQAISAHRLWLVAGDQWPDRLAQLLSEHPGLQIPSQFIRTILSNDEALQPIIAQAQEIFSRIAEDRSRQLAALIAAPHSAVRAQARICVLAPSGFHLWDDAADALRMVLENTPDASLELHCVDSDDPLQASPLALAQALLGCDALLTANLGRGDAPAAVSVATPWITWITRPRIPAPPAGAPLDRLLLADAAWFDRARAAGWDDARIGLAGWPSVAAPPGPPEPLLSIIADSTDIADLVDSFDLSSHRLLLELIHRTLLDDPCALGADVQQFLTAKMRQLGIGDEGLDRDRFREQVIVPCYQHGLARALIRQNLPLRLHGKGWSALPEFRSHAAGEVRTRREFTEAVARSTALVHVWPEGGFHPIEALGRPVVRCAGNKIQTFARDARLALAGRLPAPALPLPPLSTKLLRSIL